MYLRMNNLCDIKVSIWLILNMITVCMPQSYYYPWCSTSQAYNPNWPVWGDGSVYGNAGWDIYSDGHRGKCYNYRGECSLYRDDKIYDTGDVNETFGVQSNYIRSFGPFDLTNYKDIYFMYSFKCNGYPHNRAHIGYSFDNNNWITFYDDDWGWNNTSGDEKVCPCCCEEMAIVNYPNVTDLPEEVNHQPVFYLGLWGGRKLTRGILFGRIDTEHPTKSPSGYPTHKPTRATKSPTPKPTHNPTTKNPSNSPSNRPTRNPTISPTDYPTNGPTVDPTNDPSIDPTEDPTIDPSRSPTKDPTKNPTVDPTKDPTSDPSNDPTADPSIDPTMYPTFNPTFNPTYNPTRNLWNGLSDNDDILWQGSFDHFGLYSNKIKQIYDVNVSYSLLRIIGPINAKNYINIYFIYSFKCSYYNNNYTYSNIQWKNNNMQYWQGKIYNIRGWTPDFNNNNDYIRNEGPCISHNIINVNYPNITYFTGMDHSSSLYFGLSGGWQLTYAKLFGTFKSLQPTLSPSNKPTDITNLPTISPTKYPSINPTLYPSISPTNPSKQPSNNPTQYPSNNPSINPTRYPSSNPSHNPSNTPSNNPTEPPSNNPSLKPSNKPSINPSINPSKFPSNSPTDITLEPTYNPTLEPTIFDSNSNSASSSSTSLFNGNNNETIIIIIIGSVIILLLIICILYMLCFKKEKFGNKKESQDLEKDMKYVQLEDDNDNDNL